MADVNHAILIGRLTRDAELKYTAGGMAVCKFAIAVNRRKKNGNQWVEEASFFDIVLWGKSGEGLNQYLVKGKQVAVEGELHQNRWEQDGQSRSKVEIMASNVQLLGGNASDKPAERTPQKREQEHPARPSARPGDEQDARTYTDDTPPDFPDDIPF